MSQWQGRSLAFVRQVCDKPVRWPDCTTAHDELAEAGKVYGIQPTIGAWCWYLTPNPHGNVSLYLGDEQVLAVHPNGGLPCITNMFDPRLGTYRGWTDQSDVS